MSPFFYLVRKSLKNTLLDVLKHPGKLVLWSIVVVMIGTVIIVSAVASDKRDPESLNPMFWFTGILFLFISLLAVTSVLRGLQGGDTMFEMNDVNLLFTSPVNPRTILLYGVVKVAKTAVFACFFLLFQTANLANFGIDFGGVLLTFAGTILSMMSLTVGSVVIYSKTNGQPKRKLVVKIVGAALFAPIVIFMIVQYLSGAAPAQLIESSVNSPFFKFIPIAGWAASGVTAFLTGHLLQGFGWFGINILLMCGLVVYIMLATADYYEDVLVATETAFEKKRAIAEGNINVTSNSKRAIKVTATGIPFSGAAAIFGKHTRESFRENRFGFLTLPSVLLAAVAIAFAVFIGNITMILTILPWMQIFLIGTGRGLKDLYSHYIYMIPESSFKKIIWSNGEIMARTLIENILMFSVAGLILRSSFLLVCACILVYTMFSYLLIAVNYAIMRFTGADVSSGALLMIYYFGVMLVIAPGLVGAIVAGVMIGGDAGYIIGLLILTVWETIIGTVCFALSKNILHDCDMAMVKAK
ncbi:MAG: putative ABC exporter domain-containing protein [Clostridiales bacterium]|jgi:hypothetical protein|nr:putative ABC exporter domain-containing protein [Clostridiales bacterium]